MAEKIEYNTQCSIETPNKEFNMDKIKRRSASLHTALFCQLISRWTMTSAHRSVKWSFIMKRSWVLPALASVLLAANAHGSFMSLLGVDDSVAQLGSEVRVAVSHARKEAQILIADGNAAAKQRLSQIDEIVDEALDDISDLENKTSEDVQRILTKVKADIGEIESKLIADLNDLVWKARMWWKADTYPRQQVSTRRFWKPTRDT
jgi:DNA-directed RNA polymerase subunit F